MGESVQADPPFSLRFLPLVATVVLSVKQHSRRLNGERNRQNHLTQLAPGPPALPVGQQLPRFGAWSVFAPFFASL